MRKLRQGRAGRQPLSWLKNVAVHSRANRLLPDGAAHGRGRVSGAVKMAIASRSRSTYT